LINDREIYLQSNQRIIVLSSSFPSAFKIVDVLEYKIKNEFEMKRKVTSHKSKTEKELEGRVLLMNDRGIYLQSN
jgi:hypothetical protein